MDYKEILSISKKVSASDLDDYGNLKSQSVDFDLYDYDAIIEELDIDNKSKLSQTFYLDYFSYKLLFDIKPLNFKAFLNYYFNESDHQDVLLEIFEYELIPLIVDVIYNNATSNAGSLYPSSGDLGSGFYTRKESNELYKPLFTKEFFYYSAALNNSKSWLEAKVEILKEYIDNKKRGEEQIQKLKWTAQYRHLGFIVKNLMDKGYIEKPLKNGDFHISKAAELILNTFQFDFDHEPKLDTLKSSISPNNEKYKKTSEDFKLKNFRLPKSFKD